MNALSWQLHKRYNDKHPERALLGSAKARAKKYAVPFALTPADIIIPKRCPALGIALQRRLGASADNSPTLDRIIPSLGYVRGNVEIISSLANRIKTNASVEQIALVLKWLRRQQKGTNNG